jgi:hypothetical protein
MHSVLTENAHHTHLSLNGFAATRCHPLPWVEPTPSKLPHILATNAGTTCIPRHVRAMPVTFEAAACHVLYTCADARSRGLQTVACAVALNPKSRPIQSASRRAAIIIAEVLVIDDTKLGAHSLVPGATPRGYGLQTCGCRCRCGAEVQGDTKRI